MPGDRKTTLEFEIDGAEALSELGRIKEAERQANESNARAAAKAEAESRKAEVAAKKETTARQARAEAIRRENEALKAEITLRGQALGGGTRATTQAQATAQARSRAIRGGFFGEKELVQEQERLRRHLALIRDVAKQADLVRKQADAALRRSRVSAVSAEAELAATRTAVAQGGDIAAARRARAVERRVAAGALTREDATRVLAAQGAQAGIDRDLRAADRLGVSLDELKTKAAAAGLSVQDFARKKSGATTIEERNEKQLRRLNAETARTNRELNQTAAASTRASGGLGQVGRVLRSLFTAFVGFQIFRGIQRALSSLIDFNRVMENVRIGVAEVIAISNQFVERTTRQVIPAGLQLAFSFDLADQATRRLIDDSIRLGLPLEDLVKTFQVVGGVATSAGVSFDDSLTILEGIAVIAQRLQIPFSQVARSIDNIFTGLQVSRTQLGVILRLNSAQIQQAKEQDRLAALLLDRIRGVQEILGRGIQAQTFQGLRESIRSILKDLTQRASFGAFQQVEDFLTEVRDGLDAIRQDQKTVERLADSFNSAADAAFRLLRLMGQFFALLQRNQRLLAVLGGAAIGGRLGGVGGAAIGAAGGAITGGRLNSLIDFLVPVITSAVLLRAGRGIGTATQAAGQLPTGALVAVGIGAFRREISAATGVLGKFRAGISAIISLIAGAIGLGSLTAGAVVLGTGAVLGGALALRRIRQEAIERERRRAEASQEATIAELVSIPRLQGLRGRGEFADILFDLESADKGVVQAAEERFRGVLQDFEQIQKAISAAKRANLTSVVVELERKLGELRETFGVLVAREFTEIVDAAIESLGGISDVAARRQKIIERRGQIIGAVSAIRSARLASTGAVLDLQAQGVDLAGRRQTVFRERAEILAATAEASRAGSRERELAASERILEIQKDILSIYREQAESRGASISQQEAFLRQEQALEQLLFNKQVERAEEAIKQARFELEASEKRRENIQQEFDLLARRDQIEQRQARNKQAQLALQIQTQERQLALARQQEEIAARALKDQEAEVTKLKAASIGVRPEEINKQIDELLAVRATQRVVPGLTPPPIRVGDEVLTAEQIDRRVEKLRETLEKSNLNQKQVAEVEKILFGARDARNKAEIDTLNIIGGLIQSRGEAEVAQLEVGQLGLEQDIRRQELRNDELRIIQEVEERARALAAAGDEYNAKLLEGVVLLARQREEAVNLREVVIDLGASIKTAFADILTGSQKPLDALKSLGQRFGRDLVEQILDKKLDLDLKLKLNFERDLPEVAGRGGTATGQSFGQKLLDSVKGIFGRRGEGAELERAAFSFQGGRVSFPVQGQARGVTAGAVGAGIGGPTGGVAGSLGGLGGAGAGLLGGGGGAGTAGAGAGVLGGATGAAAAIPIVGLAVVALQSIADAAKAARAESRRFGTTTGEIRAAAFEQFPIVGTFAKILGRKTTGKLLNFQVEIAEKLLEIATFGLVDGIGFLQAPTRGTQVKRLIQQIARDAGIPLQEKITIGGRSGLRTKRFEEALSREDLARFVALGFVPGQDVSGITLEDRANQFRQEIESRIGAEKTKDLFDRIAALGRAVPGLSNGIGAIADIFNLTKDELVKIAGPAGKFLDKALDLGKQFTDLAREAGGIGFLFGGNGAPKQTQLTRATQFETLLRGDPKVNALRFREAFGFGAVIGNELRDVAAIANSLTNNFLALNASEEQSIEFLQRLAKTAGFDLSTGFAALQKKLFEGKLSLDQYVVSAVGLIRLFRDEIPPAIDATVITFASLDEQQRLSLKTLERLIEDTRSVITTGIPEAFDRLITSGDIVTSAQGLGDQFFKTFVSRVGERLLQDETLGKSLTQSVATAGEAIEALLAGDLAKYNALIAKARTEFVAGRTAVFQTFGQIFGPVSDFGGSLGVFSNQTFSNPTGVNIPSFQTDTTKTVPGPNGRPLLGVVHGGEEISAPGRNDALALAINNLAASQRELTRAIRENRTTVVAPIMLDSETLMTAMSSRENRDTARGHVRVPNPSVGVA